MIQAFSPCQVKPQHYTLFV